MGAIVKLGKLILIGIIVYFFIKYKDKFYCHYMNCDMEIQPDVVRFGDRVRIDDLERHGDILKEPMTMGPESLWDLRKTEYNIQ